MEIQNQNYFLLHCFGFWVYLTYQGGAEERQEQLLAGSVSSPLGGTPLTCLAWWDSSPPSAWHTQASYPLQCTATAYVSLTFGYTALLYVIALVYHAIPKHMMQLSAQCSTLLGPQCIPPQGIPFFTLHHQDPSLKSAWYFKPICVQFRILLFCVLHCIL